MCAAARVELDEPDPLLQQPARDEALPAEVSGFRIVQPVQVAGSGIFLAEIDQLRRQLSACGRPVHRS